jgi:DNA-binding NtrC family response regulator
MDRVLVIHDDKSFIESAKVSLREKYDLTTTMDFTDAVTLLGREKYEVVVVDLNLLSSLGANNLDGIHVLEAANERNMPCVVVSQFVTNEGVYQALKNYPWIASNVDRINTDGDRLLGLVERAQTHRPDPGTRFQLTGRPFRLGMKRALEEELWGQAGDERSRTARHLEKAAKYMATGGVKGLAHSDARAAAISLATIATALRAGNKLEPSLATWRAWLEGKPGHRDRIRDLILLVAEGLTVDGIELPAFLGL